MSKYISIFFLTIMISMILFLILGAVYMGEGDSAEGVVYIFGTIVVFLLAFIIAQVFYLIDIFKKKL